MSREEKENDSSVEALRVQIKRYEKDFLHSHGRKPERADIKKDTTMTAKYKAYKLATRPLPPPLTSTPQKRMRPSTTRDRDALHERPVHAVAGTPKKQTPSNARRTGTQHIVISPVHEVEPTPEHIRLQLGPTPQRNGQVLGIFDTIAGTPPKTDSTTKPMNSDLLVAGTPSKSRTVDSAFSKTPQSSSKRFFLDAFAGTPLKRKREDDAGTSSASKRKFATPSFLRRSFPMSTIEEDDAIIATGMPPPFRKRGLVRSLSTIIQGLRKQEEDRMDDDWDLMNEIEQQEQGGEASREVAKVLVQDSQAGDMPLGPDQAPESSEDEEAPSRGDRPRKPWKKKGLKRQTRKVIMRPVKHKAGKEDVPPGDGFSDAEVIVETQLGQTGSDGEDYGDFDEDELAGRSTPQKKDSSKSAAQDDTSTAKAKPGKKVNVLAHANFRKLKIKNKNSKANGKGGGRKYGGRR